MKVTDIPSSISTALHNRIISPLSGMFIVSWAIINWRIFFILISSTPPEKKISYIEEYFGLAQITLEADLNLLAISRLFIFPLFSVGFLVFLYPFASRFVYAFTKTNERNMLALQIKKDREQAVPKRQLLSAKRALVSKTSELFESEQRESEKGEELTSFKGKYYTLTQEHKDHLANTETKLQTGEDAITKLEKENNDLQMSINVTIEEGDNLEFVQLQIIQMGKIVYKTYESKVGTILVDLFRTSKLLDDKTQLLNKNSLKGKTEQDQAKEIINSSKYAVESLQETLVNMLDTKNNDLDEYIDSKIQLSIFEEEIDKKELIKKLHPIPKHIIQISVDHLERQSRIRSDQNGILSVDFSVTHEVTNRLRRALLSNKLE